MARDADAALELSILDVDVPIPKSKSPSWWKTDVHYAVAWLDLDPLAKQSTGTLTPQCHRKLLYFPLSSSTLHHLLPSALTIDLLSPSRFPFHSSRKLLGTAVLSLSSVGLSPETFTLPLLRPSGKPVGSIRVFARVLWDLGFRKVEEEPYPSAPSIDLMAGAPESSGSEAPTMFDSDSLPEAESVNSVCRITGGGEEVIGKKGMRVGDGGEDGGDKGRLAMGIIGAFAAVAVGVACHRLKGRV